MNGYCDFSTSLTCPNCGYQAAKQNTYRVCKPPPEAVWQPLAVGDMVERTLTAIGITQERVERWTRTEGQPGGCGCEGRKQWLNEAGFKVQRAARARLLALRDFYLSGSPGETE